MGEKVPTYDSLFTKRAAYILSSTDLVQPYAITSLQASSNPPHLTKDEPLVTLLWWQTE